MRWLLLALATAGATTRLTRPAAKQAFFVLKRGHSGSTWLSALLLNLPLTYFFDELVGASAIVREACGVAAAAVVDEA